MNHVACLLVSPNGNQEIVNKRIDELETFVNYINKNHLQRENGTIWVHYGICTRDYALKYYGSSYLYNDINIVDTTEKGKICHCGVSTPHNGHGIIVIVKYIKGNAVNYLEGDLEKALVYQKRMENIYVRLFVIFMVVMIIYLGYTIYSIKW